jgi:uncharacterized delta-60 repeat protein
MQRLITWFFLFAFCVPVAHATPNVDGYLDTSFASGGRKLIDVSSSTSDKGKVLRIQPDGKLLTAGTCGTASLIYFCATRLYPNGAIDLSFGPDGTGTIKFDRFFGQGFPTSDSLRDMLSLSDGRILFLGLGTLAMLTADGGALDTSVTGGTGFISPAFQSYALVQQSDHKILVAGFAPRNDASGNYDMAVQRLLPDLSVDTGFGTNGSQSIIFNVGSSSSFANSIALQTDGRIVLAGYTKFTGASGNAIGIGRLLQNGQIDSSFSNGFGSGWVYQTYNIENVAFAVRVDQQGRIVYAGYSATDTNFSTRKCLINRLLANGNQDFSFNANQPQQFTVPVGSNNVPCEMVDLALQTDGTVLAVGSLVDAYFTAVRLTPSGTFDSTFGTAGISYGSFDPAATYTSVRSGAMAIGSGLMIAGASAGSDYQFGIAQLTLTLHIFANGFEN